MMNKTEVAANVALSGEASLSSKGLIASPIGFLAAGAHVGIKKERKDLALIVSKVPAKVAGVFTTNAVKAAPILWNKRVVENNEYVRAIVINSGNANACTGETGILHTEIMAKTAAQALGVQSQEVLVSSTGVIGVLLPIETVTKGIKTLSKAIAADADSAFAAAQSIMTTDTYSKEFSVQFELDGKTVTVAGMAKGSGMIHPNMATMLGFITTDANISSSLLDQALKASVVKTYNMISVDGDTSTNDMVTILANGMAGNDCIESEGTSYDAFSGALNVVNTNLAKAIAADGEGATKLLECTVNGAATTPDAQKLARSVISSSLVKAAFFGEDANWGRILCALGYAGVNFDASKVSISFASDAGNIQLMSRGQPLAFDETKAAQILKEKNIFILVQLSEGDAGGTAWGCDLSYDYVRINGAYRT